MTPTDAARQLLDIDPDKYPATYSDWASRYGHTIARALLDAEERIAALDAALVHIKVIARAWDTHHVLKDVHGIADKALTPEGGGK